MSTQAIVRTLRRHILQKFEVSAPYMKVFFNKIAFGPKEYPTGCGKSKEMLLNEDYLLQQSVLIFHADYQTRFSNRLKVPPPIEPFFNAEINYYYPVAYETLCSCRP